MSLSKFKGTACEPQRQDLPNGAPPSPAAALPEPFRSYAKLTAEDLSAPVEFVAVPLLGLTAAAIGPRLSIELKRDWRERPILWLGVVGEPGTAKSPALAKARKPFQHLQQRLGRRLITSDVTAEALARLLSRPDVDGLCVVRDELAGWVASFDAYRRGRGGDRERYLSLWAGDPLVVDRATREPVVVDRPVVCIVGGIQPDKLPYLRGEAQVADGFLERFLLAFPEAGPRRWSEADAAPDLLPELEALARCPEGVVRLSPEAKKLFIVAYNRSAEACAAARSGPLQRFLAKQPTHMARLALVLHAMAHTQSPASAEVSGEAMLHALVLFSYFQGHFERVVNYLWQQEPEGLTVASSVGSLVDKVLRLLAEKGGQATRTAIHDALGRNRSARDLDAVRDALLRLGRIAVERQVPSSGGRPSEVWRLAIR